MSNVTQFPNKHIAENNMLQDLNDLIAKYNFSMTNMSMLGVLQASSNFVFLSISDEVNEESDE